MSLLANLQRKLLGPLRSEQEELDNSKAKLLDELQAIEKRRGELGAQIGAAQSEADRAAISEGLSAVNQAIEAAQRERQRLDIAAAKNKEQLLKSARERFASLDIERAELMTQARSWATELGELEQTGRHLWTRLLKVIARGREIASEQQRVHFELQALGIKTSDLPEMGEFPSENALFILAVPAVRNAMNAVPDVGLLEDGAQTFMGHFFEKVARRLHRA